MRPRLQALLHAACALLAAAVYALPTLVGAVSELSHELDHVVMALRGRGLAASGSEEAGPLPAGGAYLHAHGGPAHAHGDGLAKLLVAAQHTQERESNTAAPTLDHPGHLPAVGAPAVVSMLDPASEDWTPSVAAADFTLPPPLPPPRPTAA